VTHVKERGRTLSRVAWTGVGNWSAQLLGFAISAMLARILGPQTFGVVAIAGVYLALVQPFVNQGFGLAIIQRKDLEPEHVDTVFGFGLVLSIVVCLVTVLLSNPIAQWFDEPQVGPVLRWLSLLFPLAAFSTMPMALLERNLEFKSLAIRSVTAVSVGGVVGVVLARNGWGVWSLVGQQLVGAAASVVCLWWATPWRPTRVFSFRHLRDVYSFSISILSNDVLWLISQRIDHTLVGYRFGAVNLGPYSLANKFIQLVFDTLLSPLTTVAFPTLSRLQDDPARLSRSFARFTEIGAAICVPAMCGALVTAPDIVQVVYGPKWAAAVPLFRVFACYGAVRCFFSFMHPLMLATGRLKLFTGLFVVNAVATGIACLIGSLWSPIGVAIALTATQVLLTAIFFPVTNKVTGIHARDFLRIVAPPVLSAVGMMLGVLLVRPLFSDPLARLLVSVVAGIVSYAALFASLNRELAREVIDTAVARFTFLRDTSPPSVLES
jgi:O-antigen/teichoic acid export membrane protein